MCLNLNLFGLVPRIAFKDIKCYKVLNEVYYFNAGTVFETPYTCSRIRIGNTYNSRLVRNGFSVEDGLHSFSSIKGASLLAKGSNNSIIVECVIPKGTMYYKGEFWKHGSYASKKLTYLKVIE